MQLMLSWTLPTRRHFMKQKMENEVYRRTTVHLDISISIILGYYIVIILLGGVSLQLPNVEILILLILWWRKTKLLYVKIPTSRPQNFYYYYYLHYSSWYECIKQKKHNLLQIDRYKPLLSQRGICLYSLETALTSMTWQTVSTQQRMQW